MGGQGHDTVHSDGGWTVELVTPLKHANGNTITHIRLRPCELDQVIRWGQGEIKSTLALISEMSDVPETLLRSLTYPDIDRVLLAYTNVIPPAIRKDFEEGSRPLASNRDDLPPEDQHSAASQADPRFPKVPGPVRRFREASVEPEQPETPQEAKDDDGGIDVRMPTAAKRVG